MVSSTSSRSRLQILKIADRAALSEIWMDWVKNGGLFIRSADPFEIGDTVLMLVQFGVTGERFSVPGRVVWVTPAGASGYRPQGIGVQLQLPDGLDLRNRIEAVLSSPDRAGTGNR